jgi:hypothetical protein
LGYERQRVFVHSNAVAEAAKQRKRPANPLSDLDDPQVRNIATKDYNNTFDLQIYEPQTRKTLQDENTTRLSTAATLFKHQNTGSAPGSEMFWKLHNASVRQQLVVSFASQYQTSTLSHTQGIRSWIADIPFIKTPSKALEISAYAVALARLGSHMDDQLLIQESLSLYTHGLKLLQKALWDPELMYNDETLAACMLLALYEVFECPSETKAGYITHYNGCARLVQLRGPQAHAQGLGHSVFLGFRFMGVSITEFLTFS